jgi:hypothetical protein
MHGGVGGGLDWSPLGGNPVPGDPGEVRRLASRFDQIADEVSVQTGRLRTVSAQASSSGLWAGQAAEACRPHLHKLPGLLDKVVVSYRKAGGALSGYAPKLSAAQDKAVHALRMATEALSEQASARTAARHHAEHQQAQDSLPAGFGPPISALIGQDPQVQAAGDKLRRAHDLADEAAGDRDAAASACADGIHAASEAGIHNPGGFFHWVESNVPGVKGVVNFAEDAYHYVQDHWVDILKNISKIAGAVSAVLAVVALVALPIPILGEGVAAVAGAGAAIAAGVQLAADTTLAATGHASWWKPGKDAIIDTVALATGGVGRVAGKASEAVRAGRAVGRGGTRAAETGSEARPTTVVSAVRASKHEFWHGVDPTYSVRHETHLSRDISEFRQWAGEGHRFTQLPGPEQTRLRMLGLHGDPEAVTLKYGEIGINAYEAQDGMRSNFGPASGATGLYGLLPNGRARSAPAR